MSQSDSIQITQVAVIGAGTMGHGIAHVAASSGWQVNLFDVDEEALEQARQKVEQNLDKGVAKGKVTEDKRKLTLNNLKTTTDLATAVARAQLVIEAAPERVDLKRQIFTEVSSYASEEAILSTNTSSLSITEIAAVCHRPERFIGMHFFNPPHIVKFLEIIRAEQTSDEVVAAARQAGEAMGREMIVVSDSPGFATSRLGLALGLEAVRMLQEGVGSVEDIDRAMELGYRHPMGPLKLTDLVGLDVRLAIAEYLHRELGGEQFRPPHLLRKMVRAGKLGKKSGQGFYRW